MRHGRVLLLVLWVLALYAATYQRTAAFHSNISVWLDVIQQYPTKPRAHINYADALNRAGFPDACILELHEAARLMDLPTPGLDPDLKNRMVFLVNVELGALAQGQHHFDLMQHYYDLAMASQPLLYQQLHLTPGAALSMR